MTHYLCPLHINNNRQNSTHTSKHILKVPAFLLYAKHILMNSTYIILIVLNCKSNFFHKYKINVESRMPFKWV